MEEKQGTQFPGERRLPIENWKVFVILPVHIITVAVIYITIVITALTYFVHIVMYAWPDGRENQIASLPPAHPTHRLQHLAKVTHILHICLIKENSELEFWLSALGISEIVHFGFAQIVCFWSKLNWLLNKYSWSLYTILPSRWQGVKITLHSIGLEKDQSIFISIFMWST